MVTAAGTDPVVAAVLTALAAGGVTVGDGEAPSTAGWQGTPQTSEFVGYTVVLPLPGSRVDPHAEDAEIDVEYLVQLRTYGATRSHASQLADTARAVLLNASLTVPDRTVLAVRTESPAGCEPDDSQRPRLWLAFAAFRIFTTGGT